MEAVIFTGLQGSGKSSFYQKMFSGTHTRINLDELRTRQQESALLRSCLEQRKSFVIDNTNPTRLSRQRYIQAARTAGYVVSGYFFDSPVQDCLKRNQLRQGKAKVPAAALFSTLKKLEPLSFEEGFDHLARVRVSAEGDFDVQPLAKP